jgi:NADH-quinone oxidoreductase subunit G
MATAQLAADVPFYAGITHDEIGGKGLRWQDRPAASAYPSAQEVAGDLNAFTRAATPNGALRLGTFRSIWAGSDVEVSPALKFLVPKQRAEMSPLDAERLGVGHGEKVVIGDAIEAIVHLRDASPAGTVFVETGIAADSANGLTDELVEIRKAR